jgi:hypothetical protein
VDSIPAPANARIRHALLESHKETPVKHTLGLPAARSRPVLLLVAAAATALFACRPAPAALIITAQSVTASPGATGATFDVTLTNNGPSAVQIQGFSFGLSSNSPDITFTAAFVTTTTAPYIFAGNSAFGPEIDTTTGPTLAASDLYGTDAGVSVGAGATVGLGQVFFDVAANAPPESITLAFAAFPATSLNGPGPDFDNIAVDSLVPGTVTVSVPEPGSLTLLGIGLGCVAGCGWLRRRRAAAENRRGSHKGSDSPAEAAERDHGPQGTTGVTALPL